MIDRLIISKPVNSVIPEVYVIFEPTQVPCRNEVNLRGALSENCWNFIGGPDPNLLF